VITAQQNQVAALGDFLEAMQHSPLLGLELSKVQVVDRIAVENEPVETRLQELQDRSRLTVPSAQVQIADYERDHCV
jgi:hypothetical protein